MARYRWLKLQEDFFDDKRIKRIRKEKDGNTFIIIYLKMALNCMNESGYIFYDGLEDSISDEIALDIDEDPEQVRKAIDLLVKYGLAENFDGKKIYLPIVEECTGSETDSAIRKRKQREREKREKENKCDNVTPMSHDSHTNVTKCHTEKEKDIEKEIEMDGRQSRQIGGKDKINLSDRTNLFLNINKLIECGCNVSTDIQDITEVLDYYNTCYYRKHRKDHPLMTEHQLKDVLEQYDEFIIPDNGKVITPNVEVYKIIIDQYFETSLNTNYNISHFFNGDIRAYRYLEVLEE